MDLNNRREAELVINKKPTKKIPGLGGFDGEFQRKI